MSSLTPLVEAHHKLAYTNRVQMVAQEKKRKIRSAVTEIPCTGEAQSARDLIGQVEAYEVENRSAENTENTPQLSRRWFVFPKALRSSQYYYTADVLAGVYSDQSQVVQAHTVAVARAIDDKILGIKYNSADKVFELRDGGILGAAVDGKRPGGAKMALPSSCYIPAASAGMTLGKLKAAFENLQSKNFGLEDDEPLYCAITPKQVTDLLNIADGDGNSLNAFQQQQLQSGMPTPLLGINWIKTNRLPLDGDGNRMCPIWTKSNIGLGIWEDINGKIWNDSSKDDTPYARVRAFVDAVRLQDDGVNVILCAES